MCVWACLCILIHSSSSSTGWHWSIGYAWRFLNQFIVNLKRIIEFENMIRLSLSRWVVFLRKPFLSLSRHLTLCLTFCLVLFCFVLFSRLVGCCLCSYTNYVFMCVSSHSKRWSNKGEDLQINRVCMCVCVCFGQMNNCFKFGSVASISIRKVLKAMLFFVSFAQSICHFHSISLLFFFVSVCMCV